MANEKRLKGVSICGECGFYDWKKHRCIRGATKETDPKAPFYDDCPLADAVEVVRCKDCKYIRPEVDAYTHEVVGHWCSLLDLGSVEYEHFCSYGERRDNNENL